MMGTSTQTRSSYNCKSYPRLRPRNLELTAIKITSPTPALRKLFRSHQKLYHAWEINCDADAYRWVMFPLDNITVSGRKIVIKFKLFIRKASNILIKKIEQFC
jgi:hypothetical protein